MDRIGDGTKQSLVERVFDAMNSSYDTIILIDETNHRQELYRRNPRLPQEFWDYLKTAPSFDDLLRFYAQIRVLPEDRDILLQNMGLANLQQAFQETATCACDYRAYKGIDIGWYRMTAVNLSDGEDQILFAVGVEDISGQSRTRAQLKRPGDTILVVDDDENDCKLLEKIFHEYYRVVKAHDGIEAMKLLEEQGDDIILMLVDLLMPVCDGYELMEKIAANHRFSTIPVIVTTGSDSQEAEARALQMGAADFIRKPFRVDIVKHRVKNLLQLKHATALLQTFERDPLTGLYNKEFFYSLVEDILLHNEKERYWMVVTDIENFKMVNERYGFDAGDKILRQIAVNVTRRIPELIVCSRISGDLFAFLRKETVQSCDDGMQILEEMLADVPIPNLSVKVGIYVIGENCHLSARAICDRAGLALRSIKGVYGRYCAVYDDTLRQDMLMRQQMENHMEGALEREEFQVYLQPKYDVRDEKVAGAEALVRWIHPETGFLNPGEFIPLFEKNGFITRLDMYVLSSVCKILQKWRDQGRRCFPISVNLSRRDFEDEQLAQKIIQYVDDSGIDHQLIHFEITETAYSDDPERIRKTVQKLHEADFVIELDDFGTGYSSISILNQMEVDMVKLDMSIIRNDAPGDSRSILDFCMQLIKMLKLRAVAEGVETKEHVDRLKKLGCDYIQGFYYSKPLALEEFEGMINTR